MVDRRAAESKALSWEAFLATYLPALLLALGVGIAVPAIPTFAQSFGVSFGVATGVITSFMLGNVVGAVPSGWLVDRYGRRIIMLAGPLLTAVMAFLTATAHNFPELLTYRFFDGWAAQMWLIGRMAAISHGAAANQRGRQVSWMFGMNNTGRLIGPLIGGIVASFWGVRAPFVAYGVLALLAFVPTLFLAKDTPRRRELQRAATPMSVQEILRSRMLYFVLVLFAALARGPIQADLLHLYAAFAYHLNAREIGWLAAAAGVISLPTSFTAGWLMDRYGRKRTMVPGFTGLAIAMAALAACAVLLLDLSSYVALFLFAVASQALTGGSIQTLGADVAPAQARGMFLGLWRMVGRGGSTLSPILFAALAATVG
jgi:MFS family permease